MKDRIIIVAAILFGCLGLIGCNQPPPVGWYRTDGTVPTPEQLSVEQTICRGEVQKANLSSSNQGISIARSMAEQDAYAGCMAQRGLVLREIR